MRRPSDHRLVYLLHTLAHQELTANGSPFQAIFTGKFFVRHIGELEITRPMLEQLVANFQRFDKDPPRIPLETNHQGHSGDLQQARAIGWVVDLTLREDEGGVVSLMVTPNWSDEAREVIEAGGMRYCSLGFSRNSVDPATSADIGARVIECSLTNHPAWPGLAPIELSEGAIDTQAKIEIAAARLAHGVGPDGEADMMDRARSIATAFMSAYRDSEAQQWDIEAVFYDAKKLVCKELLRQVGDQIVVAERLWQLSFEMAEDDSISFQPRAEWQQVEHKYVPVARDAAPAAVPVAEPEKTGLADPVAAINSAKSDPPEAGKSASASKGNQMEELNELKAAISKITTALGLPEDADLAAIDAAIMALTATRESEAKLKVEVEAAKAEAAKKLSEKDTKIVALSERMTASSEETVKLSTRIKVLEDEKNVTEAKAAIDNGLKSGKLMASEVEGDDAPMRKIALSDRATFQAILDKRPASNLTKEISLAGESQTEVNPDEFWALVGAERDKKIDLSSAEAQQLVLKSRPEFNVLFQAAEQYAVSQRNKGA